MNWDEKWRDNMLDATFFVAEGLLMWIDEIGHANPEYTPQALNQMRNRLHAFFTACTNIPRWLVGDLAAWRARLDHFFRVEQYLDLFAVIQASTYLLIDGQNENLVTAEIWGTEAMYLEDSSFSDEWLRCLEWLRPSSEKNFNAAVSHKRYDKIAELCGLEFDMVDSFAWDCIAVEIAKTAVALPELEDWRDRTEQFFLQVRSSPGFGRMWEDVEEDE